MKTIGKRAMRGEKGKVLILVLVLLVLGGLVLTPLLGLASTGLVAGGVYERKTAELYAADAGVEDAIWKIMNPDVSGLGHGECADSAWSYSYPGLGDPAFEVNGKDVEVSVEYQGDGIFIITSTATSTDIDSSTTIVSYVEGEYDYVNAAVENGVPYEGGDIDEGDVIYEEGDLSVTGNIQNGGLVYVAEGDLLLDGNTETGGVVYVEGDFVTEGSIETGAQVYVMGDLTIDEVDLGGEDEETIICVGGDLEITGEGHLETNVRVFVEGNLIAPYTVVETGAQVCVQGNAEVESIEKDQDDEPPNVCAGGDLTVLVKVEGGCVYVGGEISVPPGKFDPDVSSGFEDCPVCYCEDCDICCQCIWPDEELYWAGFDVDTYNINP